MIDTIKYLLVLGISISFIYYTIFVVKKDICLKIFSMLLSTTGILLFLWKVSGINEVLFRNLFFISTAGLVIQITVMAWRIRKIPEKRYGTYAWLGTLIFLCLALIAIYVMSKIGVYG
ncbi:hypothetical protein [Clostridium weizhouense]|uniref:Uncharacterized protein n=1 Tax=Clostridium weizhouense TaxID=2859781 RepID=A0ABS7AUJ2_9CLOT|nr:hypothetical protein [Clostridium weizhouense]MBW6411928.1 hypothetical protein [Clostridium weizhouense]